MITYTMCGRLIADAEAKSDKNGNNIEKFTVAVNQNKDKSKLYTCYYRGDRGRKIHPYLTRGKQVQVIGAPEWSDYNGREYENVSVSLIELLGSKGETSYSPAPAQTSEDNPDGLPYQMDGRYFRTREELEAYKSSVFDKPKKTTPEEFDDADIPF